MSDFRNYLNEQLQRPSFKAEWDALQPELTIAQAMLDARKESGLTQKQLSQFNSLRSYEETVKRKRYFLEDFVIENLLDNICFILYYNSRIPPNGKDAENVCF